MIIFDRKYVEARNWEHRARTVVELDEMRAVCRELIAEGEERLKSLPRGQDVVPISPERPRITVFVDEGGELLSDAKTKVKGEGDYQDVIETLRTIARKYRAAEIILVWATQKPTLSGDGHGIDSQIAGQMSVRLGLAVASQTDAQTVFGRSDWPAHDLPMPGYALVFDQDKGKDQRRNPIKLRYMTAQQVIALPARPIWYRTEEMPAVPEQATELRRPTLRLVKDGDVLLAPPEPAPAAEAGSAPVQLTDSEAKVLAALVAAAGPQRHRDLVEATDMAKATVSKAVRRLTGHGLVVRDGQTYTATSAAKEVSA
uniref:MarR family transcriptional regulator n=1 Tax=Streptomyces sp. x3 TaxID=682314 RepID=UPI001567156F|nr:helix-turn-helix domain-containing protein [Streptomyces sp. x3]